jgi:hypothetical protein
MPLGNIVPKNSNKKVSLTKRLLGRVAETLFKKPINVVGAREPWEPLDVGVDASTLTPTARFH